jgi:hypothetical protein
MCYLNPSIPELLFLFPGVCSSPFSPSSSVVYSTCQSVQMVLEGGQDGSPGRLYSRNGRRLACRPCRRRKLACDHGQPVCQRCQRAKTASLCVYETGRGERPEQPGKGHQASHPSPELTTPQSISSRSGAVQARARQSQTEFLGPTSITAVLQELGGQVQPPLCQHNRRGSIVTGC